MTDLAGKRFGRLVVLERVSAKGKNARWRCQCDCGTVRSVRGDVLTNGTTRSCGCLARELSRARLSTHGYDGTPTHNSWASMIQRCTDPKDRCFAYYGGRGIRVCARWLRFENFLADMGERPDGKTLDRWPNNDLGYSKSNCRWATWSEQASNRRAKGTA